MDQSDLLPLLQQKISEAPTDTDLDMLRRDVVTAFQHCDLTPWELEETMYSIRERRSFLSLVAKQGGRLKQLSECQTLDELTEIAKGISRDYKQNLISLPQYKALCDTGRTRREELTQ